MFNKDFYPTPEPVIFDMLYGLDLTGKHVLEPSAGKGDIVDYLQAHGAKVSACELNPDLRTIVENKCKVLADDFLTVKSEDVSHMDFIVMNPPFSADEKHIMHAFEIAPPGCEIIALCNYDTYRNGYTQLRRQFRQTIDQNGEIKNLKDAFSLAERGTYVNIGLIRMKKPGSQADEFEGFFMEDEQEAADVSGIMPYNFARDLVNRYIAAVKLFDEQLDLGVRMSALTNSFFSSNISFSCREDGKPKLREDFKKDLQKAAWKWVFRQMNMEKYTTKSLKDELNNFVERQTDVPFTMRNIYKMIEIIYGTHAARMDKAIIEVFETLTMHYSENRYNVEGWKTNSHYLINDKFIMPGMTDSSWGSGYLRLSSSWRVEAIEDLLKALCYITGKNYNDCKSFYWHINTRRIGPDSEQFDHTLPAHRDQYFRYEWGKWYDWEFFEFKGYKKGTIHFKFKDKDVWAILNQHIARIKGYPLPEAVKTKKAA